jgi:hypothetical protein
VLLDGACKSTDLNVRTKSGEIIACRAALTTTMMNGQDCIVMAFIPE